MNKSIAATPKPTTPTYLKNIPQTFISDKIHSHKNENPLKLLYID